MYQLLVVDVAFTIAIPTVEAKACEITLPVAVLSPTHVTMSKNFGAFRNVQTTNEFVFSLVGPLESRVNPLELYDDIDE